MDASSTFLLHFILPLSLLHTHMRARARTHIATYTQLGTSQGRLLRIFLEVECRQSNNCYYKYPIDIRSHLNQTTGKDTQTDAGEIHLVNILLNATFCAEPPGSTVSRKGLVDAIVYGCIPIVFEPQQLVLYEAFASRQEFEEAVVYIPEPLLVGNATARFNLKVARGTKGSVDYPASMWTQANLNSHKVYSKGIFGKSKEGSKQEYNTKVLWEAMGEARGPPWAGLDWPDRALRLEPFLLQIPQHEIIAKQLALAKIAARFVIQLDDTSNDVDIDAVDVMLARSWQDSNMTGDEIAVAAASRLKPSESTKWHPNKLMQSLDNLTSAYWTCDGKPTPPSTYCR